MNIESKLKNKNARERAEIKSREISKLDIKGTYESQEYGTRLEILETQPFGADGIAVTARAWEGNNQLGFGNDGTVDIERFIIINPPIKVPSGQKVEVESSFEPGKMVMTGTFIENPVLAVKEVLSHCAKTQGNREGRVIPGNMGRTVTTVYPDADVETSTVDGSVRRGGVDQTFAAIRAGAGTLAEPSSASGFCYISSSSTSNQFAQIVRFIMLFDASSIPDTDVISAATLSLFGDATNFGHGTNLDDNNVDIVTSTPATNTDLVTGDYNQLGTTSQGSFSSIASWNNAAYNDITLNATGLGNISKTGITKFGATVGWDTAGSFTGTWGSGQFTAVEFRTADQSGTTNDPKLAITHAAPATSLATKILLMGVGLN